jgi:3-deoxy-D-manno-octulosonic-acid transferase
MSIAERLYSLSIEAAQLAFPLLERGEGKLARGIRGRRGVLERMRAWAESERDPARPLVWFHAASVGEGLQAVAVLEAFRARRPEAQLVYTYFSPSAVSLGQRVPADFADYLPLDTHAGVARALDLLRPGVIAFSKSDVWPNLVAEAKRRGTRLALLSATLPATSSRLRGRARPLLRGTYARLDAVAAISADDAERFGLLGVTPDRRSVMGDARFDQVRERADRADRGSDLLRPLLDPARLTLVAGSTWEPDEERLAEAWSRLGELKRRLVLVPHEPTPAHLERTEALLERFGLSARRLGDLGGGALQADVLLVDRVGVLGELYALADAAYVGGGWGTAGIHSVLEPAAFGVPVLYGPRHSNAREAAELVAAGGAFAVESGDELTRRLRELLGEESARRRAGEAARRYVDAGVGAAERGAAIVAALLGG